MAMQNRDKATPDELVKKLEGFRRQYNQGSITAARFRVILGYFRFTDDKGRVWTAGANSNRWYLWENGKWTTSTPPAVLNLPMTAEQTAAGEGRAMGRKFCGKCGKAIAAGWTFCNSCGTAIQ
jgi:hypothetical protein